MIEVDHPVWKDVQLDFRKVYTRYLDEENIIKKWMDDNFEIIDPIVTIAIDDYLEKILRPKIENLEELFIISRDLYSDLKGQ